MARRGFTLIEAAVGMLLACLTFGVLWTLFSFDNRRMAASMERLTALRGGEGIVEALRTDLKNLAPPAPADYVAYGNRPLLLESTGSEPVYDKLTLKRYVRNAEPGGATQTVVYRYDAAAARVLRSIDGKESQVGEARVKDFLLDYRREGASEALTYEIVTTFQGVTSIARAGLNIQDMIFRGQLDIVDRVAAADRYRYVRTGETR